MTSLSQCFSNKSSTKWVKNISNFEKEIKQETHLDTLPNRLTTLKIYLISSLRVQQYSAFSPILFSFKQTTPPKKKRKRLVRKLYCCSQKVFQQDQPIFPISFQSLPDMYFCLNKLKITPVAYEKTIKFNRIYH